MKFLSPTQNKHFYYSGKNCLFNTNQESCVAYIDKSKFDYTRGEECSVIDYTSGIIILKKNSQKMSLRFIKNDGTDLVHVVRDELQEMSNNLYDMHGFVCGTGVLVSYEYYGNKYNYEYYFYNGTKLENRNFDELNKKVNEIESKLGVYFDTVKTKANEKDYYSDFVNKCLNQDNDRNL